MIKLPETMRWVYDEVAKLGIPAPTNEMGIDETASPSALSAALLTTAGYLSYLEYMLGNAESHRSALHDAVEYTISDRLVGTDPKATIRVREAHIVHNDETIQEQIGQRTAYTSLAEQLKGYRNGYKARYDALSRTLEARKLDAELARAS